MKQKMVCILLAGMLAVSMSGCGSQEEAAGDNTGQTQQEEVSDSAGKEENQEEALQADGSVLVAYFTYGENANLPESVDASSSASIQDYNGEITGNTGAVARMISEAVGGDLFSIRTTKAYPDNYDDTVDQGQEERREGARPELAQTLENVDSYDTIFLGYPNWWGDMPMAVYTFLETYDLSGKTIIPFVTSGGSGFSSTVSEIEDLQPDASVEEGIAFGASEAADAQAEVQEWVNGSGLL